MGGMYAIIIGKLLTSCLPDPFVSTDAAYQIGVRVTAAWQSAFSLTVGSWLWAASSDIM